MTVFKRIATRLTVDFVAKDTRTETFLSQADPNKEPADVCEEQGNKECIDNETSVVVHGV